MARRRLGCMLNATKRAAQAPIYKAIPAQPAPLGAHEVTPGQVSFALWAPWKKSVHLIGGFNRWHPDADAMVVDTDGVWRIEKQFPPGAHAYQFMIDGQTAIADPYAREVRD